MRWFISYAHRYNGRDGWNFFNTIKENIHPIEWLLHVREKAKAAKGSIFASEEYKLLFYCKIPDEVCPELDYLK